MPSKPKLTTAEQLKQLEARLVTLERLALPTHVPIGEFKHIQQVTSTTAHLQATTTAPRFTTISRE